MSRNVGGIAVVLLILAMLSGPGVATAHDVPSESVMNAFVKIERDRVHLVIRVPLLLLGTVGFPADARRELDLAQAGPATQEALAAIAEDITIRENGEPLVPSEAVGRLTLPSDRSFADFDQAVSHIASPVADGTTIYADQGFFDARFAYPIGSPTSDFTIQTAIAPELGDSLKLALLFMPLDGPTRAYELTIGSGRVALDPRWYEAARVFVRLGFEHILGGIDHLLFLMCLIIPFRRLRGLLPVVTSFTVAHSITLIAAAYGVVPGGDWFFPLIETLIAASIVYMALENIFAANLHRRWLITGAFGLVHGFGFSSALRQDFQFAGSHLLLSLVSFNVGVELGQIAVLLVAVSALGFVFRFVLAERIGIIVLSALLAHTGWHWMVDRADGLRYVDWPSPDDTSTMALARWSGLVLLLIAGAGWLATSRLGLRRPATASADTVDRPGRLRGPWAPPSAQLARHMAGLRTARSANSTGDLSAAEPQPAVSGRQGND